MVPEPESEEEDTEMETLAPESTDTEMHQEAERSLLITSDCQALKIKNVAMIQRKAEEEVRNNIQSQFYEVVDQDTRLVHLKRESEEHEEPPKCRASPQQRPRNEERGRSILKKRTANTSQDTPIPRRPHDDEDEPQGVSSPLALAYPGHRQPLGTGNQACQQTAFQDAMKKCLSSYTSSRS